MNKFKEKFYSGRDPRELPAYEVSEAARYLQLPYFTLYSWLRPMSVDAHDGRCEMPLIQRPEGSNQLSFMNLIEGHVLKALRRAHNVPLPEIASAIRYAELELGVERLLTTKAFRAGARQIFIKHMGQLISLGRGGQLAMEKILDRYLERIEYSDHRAVALDPFVLGTENRLIRISPDISFGKPIISSAGITTYIVAERFELGEEKSDIANDYGVTEAEVEEAILYEQAAA